MSQENKDKANVAEAITKKTRGFIRQVRVASRRKYTSEEKVRIVLEGFRREVAVNELCRREGIKLGACYAWTKHLVADLSLEFTVLKKRLFLHWTTTATAYECRGQSYDPGPGGKTAQEQTAGAHSIGYTKKQLLSVAPGAIRFGKPEKTVEQDHSRRRSKGTGSGPGIYRAQ
ncbi:transposase [Chloroflexota bacterium]